MLIYPSWCFWYSTNDLLENTNTDALQALYSTFIIGLNKSKFDLLVWYIPSTLKCWFFPIFSIQHINLNLSQAGGQWNCQSLHNMNSMQECIQHVSWQWRHKPGSEVIKLFSCMDFLLKNMKMPTYVDIFIIYKLRKLDTQQKWAGKWYLSVIAIYWQVKFHAQHKKSFITLGPVCNSV